MIVLAGLVVALGLAALGALVWLRIGARARALRSAQAALRSRDQFIEELRQTAWDHRELDSALAQIVIDEIRNYTQLEPK